MQVKLRVLQGSQTGKEIGISVDSFIVGRNSDCHLRPRSDLISRRHCEIAILNGEVYLRDFGSRNGTYVNEKRVEGECRLHLGDHLRIGRLEFEVIIDHSLGGSKRPKVTSVKEAVSRTAGEDRTGKEDDVSQWLNEADEEQAVRRIDPETRQFKLEETDRVALDAAKDSQDEEKAADENPETVVEKKKAPGKLPKRKLVDSKDSSEAASDMLKKMFNRR